MAKIEFDFKQFLLQKGEKVGLWTCVGLGVLMLGYSLFRPGKGFLSGSRDSHAAELANLSSQKDQLISTNRPSGPLAEAEIDPRLKGTIKPPEAMVASAYALKNPLFISTSADDSRRNEPVVLTPDPDSITATPLFLKLSTYKFIDKGEKVGIITDPVVSKEKKEREKKKRERLAKGGSFSGMPGGMAGGVSGMQPGGGGMMGSMPGGMRGMGAMGMGAMGMGAMGGGGMRGSGGGMPGMGTMGAMGGKGMGGPTTNKVITFVKADELDKHPNAVIAEEIRPTRAVEIVAAFPLREQYRAVERALHLPNTRAVVGELEFDGYNVERRLLLPDRKTPAPGAAWVAVDIKQQWASLYVTGGKRVEPEDPELQPLLSPWSKGLAYPRLQQQIAHGSGSFGKEEASRYPKVEMQAPQIVKALDDLKKAGEQVIPHKDLKDTTGVDPFEVGASAEVSAPGMMNPDDMKKRMMNSGRAPAPSGKTGSPEENSTAAKADYADKLEVPEYSLVRFFDFDLEPGAIYQYRFRVRVKNMNKDRTDVAYPEIADKKVLTSPWVTVPKPVPMPDEMQYFAIDLKKVDWQYDDKGEKKQVANKAGIRGAADPDPRRGQAVVHIQRWLNTINVSSNPKENVLETVGDWAMGERVAVYRGEYMGHTVKQKVAIWSPTEEDYILATDPYRRGSEKTVIGVSFAPEAGFEDAILVDFQGGNIEYNRVAVPATEDEPAKYKAVKDNAPMELLIMTPDGRLVVRDSVEDMENADAKTRYINWLERIKEVENKASKDNQGPGKPNPFGAPGGKGGGGGGS
ncbi:MAG: hypothetical protein ACJ8FY_08535 [Gemmataceae bacterium]